MHLAATTMVRLNIRQRAALADTVREFANLAAAALVLGRLVSDQPPSWSMLVAGAITWVTLMAFAILLLAGEE